jgi:general secretion pathway protein A
MICQSWCAARRPQIISHASPNVYPTYFGLKEASFSITPDPQYLFLSEQHREALAHLLYGAGENGGFVLLTGEVGTGKTTICRAFLEQVPDNVDVALVLNPAMTAIELMHAICDEFGVEVPAGQTSVKGLVDRLNAFLLEAHARGRHPVLIIDEAQNLRPKVLEQVRLLTNLETSKHKLLQIFLLGQPELRAMLASPELRQLNQRITARFHLKPLGARETSAYVEHRIAVAGVDRPLFSGAALRAVHRCSGGVPRLINLICDRSLLGAAVSRQLQANPHIVRRAAKEVLGGDVPSMRRRTPLAALAALILLAAGTGIWLGSAGFVERLGSELLLAWHGQPATAVADVPADPETPAEADVPETLPATAVAEAPLQPQPSSDAEPLASESVAVSGPSEPEASSDSDAMSPEDDTPDVETTETVPRIALARVTPAVAEADADELDALTIASPEAVSELMNRWGRADAEGLGCRGIAGEGLDCERGNGRWSDIRLFDRPVALKLDVDGQERYAVVGGLDDEYALLHRGGEVRRMPIAVLDERWSGDFLLLWQLPPSGVRMIGAGAYGDAVHWLRARLAALPDIGITSPGPARWDRALTEAVRRFQSQQGLISDGIAGPRTLILLSNALADAGVPRLDASAEIAGPEVPVHASADSP